MVVVVGLVGSCLPRGLGWLEWKPFAVLDPCIVEVDADEVDAIEGYPLVPGRVEADIFGGGGGMLIYVGRYVQKQKADKARTATGDVSGIYFVLYLVLCLVLFFLFKYRERKEERSY